MSEKNNDFIDKWGEQVLKGGFSQVPNDYAKSLRILNINPYESVVTLYILSIGKGYASAKRIAEAQNIGIGTVRKCFRSLENKGYLERVYVEGEANRFNIDGLIKATKNISSKRQSDEYLKSRGMYLSDDDSELKENSNK